MSSENLTKFELRMEKVMVNPWLPQGGVSYHSAVCTYVICFLCCLSFVSKLGYSLVRNLLGECNAFELLKIFSYKWYDLKHFKVVHLEY